jgi:ubiquinol-cytochrome c reductase cytochrome b subunit
MGVSMRDRVWSWLDERTGASHLLAEALDEPIPGGARWAYVFGSALLTALILQIVTGSLLAFYYVPSIDHAHTTVAYVQKEVLLGWLVRGVHYYGASAVIVVMLLHLTQVTIWGAYKERREALWLVGVVLLNILLGFGFTGYLLPWDQKAYFGTQVAGGIAGSIPVVGDEVARLVLGGSGVGQATLSRFFAIHVFVLPAILILLTVVHVYLFRFAGPAGPTDPRARATRVDRFYPKQFFKDTLTAVLIALLLAILAGARPAPLGPVADPSTGFVPRPEWYFLWTFQLLKVIPAFVGGIVLPGVIMTALALLPFVDRSKSRALRSRLVVVGLYVVVLAGMGVLTAIALVNDARDPSIVAQEEAAHRFMAEPFEPDAIGRLETVGAKPAAPAPEPYEISCSSCHGKDGKGGVGPSLHAITSKPRRSVDDIVDLLARPEAYDVKPPMPAFSDMPEEERRAIAEWLATLE